MVWGLMDCRNVLWARNVLEATWGNGASVVAGLGLPHGPMPTLSSAVAHWGSCY